MASLFSQSPLSLTISFLIIIIFFFSTTKSQQQTITDPSYYYNLCAPSTCGNLTFSYPFSLPNLCHHPRLNSTCQDNNQHLVLQGQPQSDPHRVISNIKINGSNFTIPIASNALFRCGHISKPNFVTDSSIFSISDKYTYGTHLNCTRRPANGQALMPVSCLGCEGDADPNVCYYMQGFVSFPECESFYIYPPKGVNVSAEKDLRGFLKKGLEITYTMSSECESCQGSGGRCGARPDGSFACFCPSSVHTQNCSDEVIDLRTWKPVARKSGGSKVLVVALSTSASIVILIALATLVGIFFYWQKSKRLKDNEKGMDNKDMPQTDLKDVVKGISPTRYSYPEIKKFTNNFATKLGEGGFGSVYKGIIQGSGNDVNVAIKLLKISKQSEKQFKNEVATVGRIHHQHLVRLLGYCVQGKRRALVYEFMENGSLDKYIYRTKKEGNEVEEDNDFEPLSSKQLYNIALETARGLLYLHEGCRSRILHCDIKPHNVLLDSKFSAKVSDFGLARMIDKDHSHVSFTAIQGTPEYMAPEMWSKSYGVTEKSDVYSYENLAKQLVSQGHVLDLFASALDQVGVAEMKVVVEKTGGLVVLAESFGHSVFRDSFKRIFEDGEQSLGLAFNGTLEIFCSKDIKIQGIIGPCTSLEKKGPSCSDTVIGQGNTTSWKMCGLDKSTCLTVFFDVSPSDRSNPPGAANQYLYLQFLTNYQNPQGQMRLRVTTIQRKWADSSANSEELVEGFDQEAAAVVMARLTSLKMEMEEEFDATRWLDRSLIRLCSRFGDYRKDDSSTFTLNPSFSILPQFMFNLRRSQFVQVFNNSPDETAYFRMLLNRESITNSVVMIQPSLISYSFNSPPAPALLDVASIAADRILLLDAYFSVVIFHGMTIAQWRNMGYHKQPEHQAFAQLLQAPQDDAQMIIKDRFPIPRLVVCDQHGSQARFLLAKLNPSATYNSAHEVAAGSDVIFTDDVSLQVFFEHLQRLAVQS